MDEQQFAKVQAQQSYAIQAYLEAEGSIRALLAQVEQLKKRQDILFADIVSASGVLKEASQSMSNNVEAQPRTSEAE